MKILFLILFIPIICIAQDETLLGEGEISSGGFGGPAVKFSKVKNDFGVLVGGRGGWIINHRVILGGGGYGLANKILLKSDDGRERRLDFGYGGFELGIVMNPHSLLHSTFTLLIGGGGVNTYDNERNHDYDDTLEKDSGLFVLEPEVNAELNIATYFRITLGLSYRFVFGVEMPNISNKDLSFGNIVMVFKFGSF